MTVKNPAEGRTLIVGHGVWEKVAVSRGEKFGWEKELEVDWQRKEE